MWYSTLYCIICIVLNDILYKVIYEVVLLSITAVWCSTDGEGRDERLTELCFEGVKKTKLLDIDEWQLTWKTKKEWNWWKQLNHVMSCCHKQWSFIILNHCHSRSRFLFAEAAAIRVLSLGYCTSQRARSAAIGWHGDTMNQHFSLIGRSGPGLIGRLHPRWMTSSRPGGGAPSNDSRWSFPGRLGDKEEIKSIKSDLMCQDEDLRKKNLNITAIFRIKFKK